MATNIITSFYRSVSRAIRRGSVYDTDIPGYVTETVRELEDLHNMKHMWVESSGNLVVGTGSLDLTGKIKSVRFMNIVDDNANEYPIKKTRRENVISIASGRPGAFWMMDNNTLGFDALPDKTYAYTIGYYAYSPAPLVDTLAFLTIGPDLLRAMSIVNMAPLLRDQRLTQYWGQLVDKRLPAFLEAQVVHEEDGIENRQVPFADEMIEDGINVAKFT